MSETAAATAPGTRAVDRAADLVSTVVRADLPLSFNNETGRRVVLRIKFDSDKLEFTGPGGSDQVLTLEPHSAAGSSPG